MSRNGTLRPYRCSIVTIAEAQTVLFGQVPGSQSFTPRLTTTFPNPTPAARGKTQQQHQRSCRFVVVSGRISWLLLEAEEHTVAMYEMRDGPVFISRRRRGSTWHRLGNPRKVFIGAPQTVGLLQRANPIGSRGRCLGALRARGLPSSPSFLARTAWRRAAARSRTTPPSCAPHEAAARVSNPTRTRHLQPTGRRTLDRTVRSRCTRSST